MSQFRSFTRAREYFEASFRTHARKVHTEKWQGNTIANRPDMMTYELFMENIQIPLFGIENIEYWQKDIKPNLPWADDHFEERVCGCPLNPGMEWRNWPWADSADKHRSGGTFNHTYPERLWPKHAAQGTPIYTAADFRNIEKNQGFNTNTGLREPLGDLNSLVNKLAFEPMTRQAYIPLYFPEDTGLDGRMPCTLGYQLIMRDNALSMYYPLRSCDLIRHWADDCYLALRLLLWILSKCRELNEKTWKDVKPGSYHMHMTSLHIFANDAITLGVTR